MTNAFGTMKTVENPNETAYSAKRTPSLAFGYAQLQWSTLWIS